jgi:hypothetical protein
MIKNPNTTGKSELSKAIENLNMFNEKLIEFSKAISTVLQPLSDLIKKIPEDTKALSSAGWFFIGSETPFEAHQLADILRNSGKAALDSAIISIYEIDNWEPLEQEINKTLIQTEFSLLKDVIMECLWAHKHGKYRLPIIAGLTVVESMIATFSGKLLIRDIAVRNQWEKTFVALGEIEYFLEKPFFDFLNNLWASTGFDKPTPSVLNRHWIMHRLILMTSDMWTKANSLRILLAIVFIGEITKRRSRSRKNKANLL